MSGVTARYVPMFSGLGLPSAFAAVRLAPTSSEDASSSFNLGGHRITSTADESYMENRKNPKKGFLLPLAYVRTTSADARPIDIIL